MGFTPAGQAHAASQGPGVIIACQADKRFKEFSVNDNAQPTDAKVSARRRLLRGAFSTPVVLTLYSGSALASASSQRCMDNQIGKPVTKLVAPDNTDGWMRVQLYKKDGRNKYFVVGNSLPANRSGSPTLPSNGQAGRVYVDSVNDGANYNKMDAPISTPASISLTNKWASLRFDNTGKCVGIGATGGGSALAQSCWTSFVAGV
jgi:hypothetical protein